MRAKRLIPAACIISVAIGYFLFFRTVSPSSPALIFHCYEISPTHSNAVAKLELFNRTDREIWLYYYASGSEFPSTPEFLERQTEQPPKPTNETDAFAHGLYVGAGFNTTGKKMPPGDSVQLEIPLRLGEPAKQVGIVYYLGRFSNGTHFVCSFYPPFLDNKANLKDKAVFYWQRLTGKFKAPERHEVWCKDLLSFHAATTNSPPK